MRLRTWWAGLGLVLAVAAAVRFARLGWGLDDGTCFPDELEWLERMRAFATITQASFDPPKLTYPTLRGGGEYTFHLAAPRLYRRVAAADPQDAVRAPLPPTPADWMFSGARLHAGLDSQAARRL